MITDIFVGTGAFPGSDTARPTSPAVAFVASFESRTSRRTMASALKALARFLGADDPNSVPWATLDPISAWDLRSRIVSRVRAGRMSWSTANLWLAALRGTLRYACLLDLMSSEKLQKVCSRLKEIRGARTRFGRALSEHEILRLFEVCARQPERTRARNLAMLSVLLAGGLRRAEVVGLDLEDWRAEECALRVLGKGLTERTVFLGRQAPNYLDDWIRTRGSHPGPLFHPISINGTIKIRRCSMQMVYDLLDRLSRRAVIPPVRPHDCRRTMISALLDRETDVLTVMRQSGHSSVAVFAIYDRRSERAQRGAVEQMYCPAVHSPTATTAGVSANSTPEV